MNSVPNDVLNNEVTSEATPGRAKPEVFREVKTEIPHASFAITTREKTNEAMGFGQGAKGLALKFGKSLGEQIAATWTKLAKLRDWRPHATRQLRLCETLPLGERRFLSIVQFEEQRFLIGSAGNSVVLLTRLEKREQAATVPKKQFKKKQTAVGRRKHKSK